MTTLNMNLEYYVGSFLMYTLSHHHHNKHDFVPSSLRDMYPNYVLQSQSLPTQREDESWMMNVFRRPNPRINFDSDLELSISSFGFSDSRRYLASNLNDSGKIETIWAPFRKVY